MLLQTERPAAYLKIQQILLVKMIQIPKSWASWPLKMGSQKVNKEAENGKSLKAPSTKTQTNGEKSRSWFRTPRTVREIYDYLTG